MQQSQRRAGAVRLNDEQTGDLALVHDCHGFFCQCIRANGGWVACHDLRRVQAQQTVHVPPQVAIGDDAGQRAIGRGHTGHAKPFLADFDQRITHASVARHHR